MILKMLGNEILNQGLTPPRQVLVTQSPILAERIGGYFKQLYASLQEPGSGEAGMNALTDRMTALPERFSELQDKHFPIITTVSKVRLMRSLSRQRD